MGDAMTNLTGGELLAKALANEGVEFVFGLPCPEIDPLLAALATVGIRFVTIRHEAAAVHMAEAGIPMEEIAQYLGHEDVGVTRKVYARFSPAHLQRAAAVLDYGDFGSANQATTTFLGLEPPEIPGIVVGATGIEPVTPTMSRTRRA